tara:strand:+ start:1046 stop:1267 length:222 start_codon:yes stop_codon:yes gene_type:complete
MTEIYMDRETCEEFDIDYYEHGQKLSSTPAEIISVRNRFGKSYDENHMNIFESLGIQNTIVLEHKGVGWFEVV